MGNFLLNLLAGVGKGLGETVGKIGGKMAEWVPGPQQYRRGKIRELTDKMLIVQRTRPFNSKLYEQLRAQRDKLEAESENSGT